jgi:hypothetical protein
MKQRRRTGSDGGKVRPQMSAANCYVQQQAVVAVGCSIRQAWDPG